MKFYEILKELKKGFAVEITDYSNAGGAYSYTQRYEKLGNENWKRGILQNGECSCGEEYEEVSSEEFARILEYAWEDPKHEIRIK